MVDITALIFCHCIVVPTSTAWKDMNRFGIALENSAIVNAPLRHRVKSSEVITVFDMILRVISPLGSNRLVTSQSASDWIEVHFVICACIVFIRRRIKNFILNMRNKSANF